MNRLLQIILKEIFFYWLIASIIMLIVSLIYFKDNYIYKIISIISILISKVVYEQYIANFYRNKYKIKKAFDLNDFDKVK